MKYKLTAFNQPLCALILCLVVLVPVLPAKAQQIFTLDQAAYRQKGGMIYLEVYLMVHRDGLKFIPAEAGYQAQMNLTLDLYAKDSLLSSTSWEVMDKAKSLEEITPRQKLPDIAIFPQLSPGPYRLEGKLRDVQADTLFSRRLDFELVPFSDSLLSVSELELANRLERTDSKGKFWKNGFLVIPNPERLYGSSMPMVYFYAEIYNLEDTTGIFVVNRAVLNTQRQEIKRLPQKTHKKVGTSAVEVDGFSIASLETGTYYLQLSVEDPDADTTAVREAKFFVFRAEDFTAARTAPVAVPSPDEIQINALSDEEVNDSIEELKFLLDDAQWRSLTALTPGGKRQFLIRFWKERDPDPRTAVNEYRASFNERKEFAEQKYSYLGRHGWKTDRGRVYILYGQPDKIDFHPHDIDARPYEVWYYDAIEGGVMFVFVDRNNFGDYRLVHSTKNGELYRADWYQQEATVRRGESGGP
jgi:GWxTD domain-containing protein